MFDLFKRSKKKRGTSKKKVAKAISKKTSIKNFPKKSSKKILKKSVKKITKKVAVKKIIKKHPKVKKAKIKKAKTKKITKRRISRKKAKIKKVVKKKISKKKGLKKKGKKTKKILERKSEDVVTKMKLGIKGFDDLFAEGIPEGASVLVEGGPGSGKTIFCLQLAYNACLAGKKVLYMTFEEPEKRLLNHMRAFGWNADKYIKSGHLEVRKFNSLDVARSVEALLSEAKRELLIDIQPILIPKDFKPDIVCIDSLSSIASAFSGEDARFRVYMEQLFKYLESHDITSFLIRETSHPTHLGVSYTEKGSAVSFLSDGIIVLYSIIFYDGNRGRGLEVLKMRGEDIKRKIVEVDIINKKGMIVYPNRQLKIKGSVGSYKLT
ncbi:MAG: ATPase domain-containing protein [archaeon]|nr:ATPase domain-containing protein [archaeon]